VDAVRGTKSRGPGFTSSSERAWILGSLLAIFCCPAVGENARSILRSFPRVRFDGDSARQSRAEEEGSRTCAMIVSKQEAGNAECKLDKSAPTCDLNSI